MQKAEVKEPSAAVIPPKTKKVGLWVTLGVLVAASVALLASAGI
jgi:hypothetical protein